MKQKKTYQEHESSGKRTKQNIVSKGKRTTQQCDPKSYYTLKASWRFHHKCKETKWSIFKDNWKVWEEKILPKLINYQTMTWTEITGASKGHGTGSQSHNVPLSGLTKEGKEEIDRLKIMCDQVFSLRLSGTERIIGVLDKGVLEILCYDDKHELVNYTKSHS